MRAWRRPVGAALLALALVAAQALGLAHVVAHGPPSSAGAGDRPGAELGIGAHACAEESTLFGSHEEGGAECRLFDEATQADALKAAAWPALPPRASTRLSASAPAVVAEAGAHAYLARGPPLAHRAGSRAA